MRIVLVGATGAMGRVVTGVVAHDADAEIVAGVALDDDPALGYPLYPAIADVSEAADVVIDFSLHAALPHVAAFAAGRGIPAVVAATGHTDSEVAALDVAAETVPVLRAGNLSLGVTALVQLVEQAAALLPDFDIEIVEQHHRRKRDAPSGTAAMLADAAERGHGAALHRVYGREGLAPRQPGDLGLHSVRGGTVVGEHEVILAGEQEVIRLVHQAESREIFAHGALAAARFLQGKPAGHYSMRDVVNG